MKRLFAINALIFVALAAHCAPLATENFVTNKIAAAISQIPPPDFSTNNAALVETIEAKAPAPGDYAAVSNAAVNAVQKSGGTVSGALNIENSDIVPLEIKSNYANNDFFDNEYETALRFSTVVSEWFDTYGCLSYLQKTNGAGRFAFISGPYSIAVPSEQSGVLAMQSELPKDYANVSNKAMTALQSYTETDPTVPQWAKAQTKPTYTASEVGATTPADIAAAISPTSPAFSNAVLSVGLGIDMNTVAVINELVDSAHDLPVSGATSVGALLLALAAAVAALKKKLSYDLVTKEINNGAVTLDDRASNAVEISATLSPNTLTINFPATSGKARDFALRLNIASGVTAPELVLPQGVVCENADGEMPEISDGGTGGSSTILYFSETENNGTTAKFLLKGETLTTIAQA